MRRRILVRGSGLGAALFACLAAAEDEVHLLEAGDDAPDLGAVLDEEGFARLADSVPELAATAREWRLWERLEIRRDGTRLAVATGRRRAIAERTLAAALRRAAAMRGCRLAAADAAPDSFDLVIAADGADSPTRRAGAADFDLAAAAGRNRVRFAVTDVPPDQPVFSLRAARGGLFHATLWPLPHDRAVLAIEAVGAADASEAELGALFAEELGGAALRELSPWRPVGFFQARRRVSGRVALIGRAAATAHWTLAADARGEIEDALALSEALRAPGDVDAALAHYQDRRGKAADSLHRASEAALHWCETLPFYGAQDAAQFAFGLATRHHRVDYETVKARDPGLVARLEAGLAARAGASAAMPPMFCPFRIKGLELDNRVVFSPMAMRQGTRDGTPTDFHLVHLGDRAMGGAGLVFAEMTNVSPEGRISHTCVGMYRDEHVAAWRRIVAFVHAQSTAKIALQLGHAGRKGSTRRAPDGRNVPLAAAEEGWQLLSASAVPWSQRSSVPKAADRGDMDKIVADYARAARQAGEAGFDLLEIHMAHGYLLSSFISPLSNRREDGYGGSLANRMRFPLEVLRAVRAEWPAERPLSVRISAHDWRPDGLSLDEAVAVAALLKADGCDLITVSSGHTTSGVGAGPDHGRLYQVPFSDRIRNEVGIATIAVGTIFSWGDVNSIIAAGRADLCALGRGHLFDPYFTRHAAYAQGHALPWPFPYRTAALFKPHRFA